MCATMYTRLAPSGESYGGNRRRGPGRKYNIMAAYRQVDDFSHLQAYAPGSAPVATLGNEYGRILLYL